jgi:hypothetical protein
MSERTHISLNMKQRADFQDKRSCLKRTHISLNMTQWAVFRTSVYVSKKTTPIHISLNMTQRAVFISGKNTYFTQLETMGLIDFVINVEPDQIVDFYGLNIKCVITWHKMLKHTKQYTYVTKYKLI